MHDLEKLFELSNDMLCVAGTDGFFKQVNPAFERVLGYCAQELTSISFLELVHPEDRAATLEEVQKLSRGEKTLHFENRYRCKDGSYRWLAWTSVPDAGAGLMYAVARDVTAPKSRLDDLMRDLPGMVYRCLADGPRKMEYVSEGCRELTGYSPGELTRMPFAALVHPEDLERVRQEVQAALAANREFELEYRLRTANGQEKLVAERGRALAGNGAGGTLQGFITDISEHRRLKSELLQLHKMDSLGQLTGGIAHDFNNLLTVIIGNLELLETSMPAAPETAELVNDVKEAAWRGAELSQRLLAFARRQMLVSEAVSVNDLVLGMESLMRRTLGAAIDIDLALEEGLPAVWADASQLENALLNLAINSRDAMADGGTLLIRTGRFTADDRYTELRPDVVPGSYVMVEVSDSGTGMSKEVQERVFEPFFTTKGPGKGTGLGLSMVYGLLKQLGGHARIYSELGYGTSVKLFLPEAPAGELPGEPGITSGRQPSHGGGKTVLVVEDDPAVRKMVVQSLAELGYRTLEADSGPRGFEALQANWPGIDLLLTDIVMPGGMTGLELARLAREQFAGIKVLLTSGFSQQHVTRGSEFPLLGKPYRKAELAQAVRRALRQGKARKS